MILKLIEIISLKRYYRSITKYLFCIGSVSRLIHQVNWYRMEHHKVLGKIRILEEQQEIMHNFLVEINKYIAHKIDEEQPLK